MHIEGLAEARQQIREIHARGKTLGSIHTLGALHEGHSRVIETAAGENDEVLVTVYPNKAQLAPGTRYRYDLAADVQRALASGATIVVSSDDIEMYPPAYRTFLDQGVYYSRMDGTILPHLFRGMVTMCLRWIIFCRPTRTYWGMKDIGQALLVQRAVADLMVDTTVRTVPCVRYANGIPVSSRLMTLDREALDEVERIFPSLEHGRTKVLGGCNDPREIEASVRSMIERGGLKHLQLRYCMLVDPLDFATKEDCRPPFILHTGSSTKSVNHFDGLYIPDEATLASGTPIIRLPKEGPWI